MGQSERGQLEVDNDDYDSINDDESEEEGVSAMHIIGGVVGVGSLFLGVPLFLF